MLWHWGSKREKPVGGKKKKRFKRGGEKHLTQKVEEKWGGLGT